MEPVSVLGYVLDQFSDISREKGLLNDHILVTSEPLTAGQAIGTPSRKDYPLLTGKEVLVEAEFRGGYGQAFTSNPRIFQGSIKDVLELPDSDAGNRAIKIATLNAVTGYLGLTDRLRHCKDEEPEKCAAEMAQQLLQRFGRINTGIIGYQPAIIENAVRVFGPAMVKCTDLNENNIGVSKYGIEIWDGNTDTFRIINCSDLVLVTSSTLSNDTFDTIFKETRSANKRLIMFGVTGAGVSMLLGIERLCFFGH